MNFLLKIPIAPTFHCLHQQTRGLPCEVVPPYLLKAPPPSPSQTKSRRIGQVKTNPCATILIVHQITFCIFTQPQVMVSHSVTQPLVVILDNFYSITIITTLIIVAIIILQSLVSLRITSFYLDHNVQ